jgi:cytochrome c
MNGSYIWKSTLLAMCAAIAAPLAFDRQGAGRAVTAGAAQPDANKPDDNRFTPIVVIPPGELDEPMAFEVLHGGRVLVIERKGALKVYDPASKTTKLVATIPVNTKYTNAAGEQREAEEGLVGLTVDPNFEQNHWIYMLYADPQVLKHVLARWELSSDALVEDSKKVLLEYTVQREQCCHTGGGMTWDANGNLYLTVGNNTSNSIGAQTDERPGRQSWDDQRGAANTNDLRGKILRIHPEPDGTYTIPSGNLFPPGTPGTRPEIYTMGHRNAWRVSIDSKTGFMYWGEVGPDATEDTELGPRGYDEMNQARGPGFFGWPYFIGNNAAYPYFDYAKGEPLAPKDPKKPVNASVNNTGLRELPSAQPAFIWYPYGVSEEFPEVGTGGRSATGGPIYRRADFPKAARPFPDYYEGKWLTADLSRGWIMSVAMDDSGTYQSMERFAPHYKPSEVIDIKFAADGDLYVLDYGSTWFAKSPDSQLVRIEYNGGNRAPSVEITADRTGGVAPFKVAFSSAGTIDHDGDRLAFEWTIESAAGDPPRVFKTANPTVPFERNGIYVATLTVTDPAGGSDTASLDIIAGNDPPAVIIETDGPNRTFFTPGQPIAYSVKVTDREDGTLASGQITPQQVAMSIDYVPEGFNVSAIKQGQTKVDPTTRFAIAKALIASSDCATCHNREAKSRGPSFVQLAEKYKADPETLTRLATKIRAGGSGVWGEEVMPAHPLISMHEARTMAEYMLSAADKSLSTVPMSGSYTPIFPEGDPGRGSVVLRAVYTDKGAKELPAQTAEALKVLRSPKLGADTADIKNGIQPAPARGSSGAVIPRANGHIGFKALDLTGMARAEIAAQATSRGGNAGGTIEIRLGSPAGPLIGEADVNVPGSRDTTPTATQIQEAGGAARTTPTGATPGATAPPQGTAAAGRGRGGRGGRGGGVAGSGPVTVDLKPTTGVHDVFFVFKNERAAPIQPLMTLSTITLLPQ